ncbi:hypothetical protein AK34_1203 [Burkholderia dolosa AU0158]|nr:hypothetical protein AK34_1203 [Burkholderia dolosa AU0158]
MNARLVRAFLLIVEARRRAGAWLRGGGSRLRGFRRDSKGCACKRSRGLRHVGESRPLRQTINARLVRAFLLIVEARPHAGAWLRGWRKPPARLPAGLEGLRLQAQPRPASRRRVPSAPPTNKCPPRAGIFVFCAAMTAGRAPVTVCAVHISIVGKLPTTAGLQRLPSSGIQLRRRVPPRASHAVRPFFPPAVVISGVLSNTTRHACSISSVITSA